MCVWGAGRHTSSHKRWTEKLLRTQTPCTDGGLTPSLEMPAVSVIRGGCLDRMLPDLCFLVCVFLHPYSVLVRSVFPLNLDAPSALLFFKSVFNIRKESAGSFAFLLRDVLPYPFFNIVYQLHWKHPQIPGYQEQHSISMIQCLSRWQFSSSPRGMKDRKQVGEPLGVERQDWKWPSEKGHEERAGGKTAGRVPSLCWIV